MLLLLPEKRSDRPEEQKQGSRSNQAHPSFVLRISYFNLMIDKLEAIKGRFEQVGVALTNPEIVSNPREFSRLSKEYKQLEKIVIPFEAYKRVLADVEFSRELLEGSDAEMRELAKAELP
jgi:protein subunit release factor A